MCCTWVTVTVIFSHTSSTRSAFFTCRMTAPTIISTTNHYTHITQQFNYKKNTCHLLNMIHCFNIFCQFLKMVCTSILTVLAPQTLRNVKNSSPTWPILERSPNETLVARVHMGYQVDEMQEDVLKAHALCSGNCYFLMTSSVYKHRIFLLLQSFGHKRA